MRDLAGTLRGEARDAAIFTASNVLNRLGGLALLTLYWTKLSPSDYGILAVIGVIGAFQTLLSSMSLDLAITRFYYEWSDDLRARNLGTIWTWNWLMTLAVTVAFLFAVPIVGPTLFPDVTESSVLLLGVVANAGGNLFLIPASTIRIKRLPWLFASYNLVGFLTSAALGVWLVLVLEQGLIGLLISILCSNFLLAVFGFGVMLRFSRPGLASPGFPEAVRFAVRAVPAALINTTAQVLDRVLLGLFANLEVLGLYSVARRFTDVIGEIHNSLKMAYAPFMMKNMATEDSAGRAVVSSVTPYYLIPYFAVGVGLTMFIGPLVRVIGQPDYFGVEVLVPWLVGANILGALYFYYCNGIFLAKRTGLLSLPAAVHLVVLAVVSLLLIAPYQLAGVIVSRYIGVIVMFGLSLYISQKVFPLQHRWDALIRLGAAAIGFGVIGQLLELDSLALEVIAKAVALCGFIALSLVLVGGRGALQRLRELAGVRLSKGEPDPASAASDSPTSS